jgi:hypothetical protein
MASSRFVYLMPKSSTTSENVILRVEWVQRLGVGVHGA